MICPSCGDEVRQSISAVNRALRCGAPLYCSRACASTGRRLTNPPTDSERREAKRLYDIKRRKDKYLEIKAQRAIAYASRDRERERARRKENMWKHIEYCSRPEYREWKSEYDKHYRATRMFGEFAESFIILQKIQQEINERATRYEIYQTNGTLNKAQMRRRTL